jgi:protein arginine N-methyltransferase 5
MPVMFGLQTSPIVLAKQALIDSLLQTPIYFPDRSELDVSIWRQTDDRKVWYEWRVEAFLLAEDTSGDSTTRVRIGGSDLHSSKKNGCRM